MTDRGVWSDAREAAGLPGHMGVYELADAAGRVIYIGCAGGRSRFGLRGEVQDALARIQGASRFRIEITTAYLTRHRELLMRHRAAHGELPAANEPVPGLGRLSPG